ncbi:hypothetical protein BP6252_05721 [Coleophoma cylindrospora]|uniref:Heterokaryon incompatibility domain-containing protein n=1 Tax=Coleophoma cylindrospora TaxID=1849047 RepID=A0A3D8RUL5_9HELO|nr:hypothetical protein BP6252_05721 [Coleophoma cylindrospora]
MAPRLPPTPFCIPSPSNSPDGFATYSPYKPLGENQIRLVKIQPATSERDDVYCHLIPISRDSPLQYRALSYAWGPRSERDVGRIYLEGERHAVTRTLEIALRKLRRQDNQPFWIWVDALCINQDDHNEKREQVEKMRLIYEHAKEVSVWLGPEDASSNGDLAWKLIKQISGCPRNSHALSDLVRSSRKEEFSALTLFYRRDYFWRVWVVQEIACASKATVYYSSESIPWPVLVEVCDKLSDVRGLLRGSIYHDNPTSLFSLMTGGPKNLAVLRASTKSTAPLYGANAPSLFDLMSMHMGKSATDARDKVYGIVGISADRETFGSIDYDRSVQDTYIYTARHLIESTRSLNVICIQQNDTNVLGLPSWVPDWERRHLYPAHRPIGLRSRKPRFSTSGSSSMNVAFLNDGKVLSAAGFVVDTIKAAAEPLYVEGPESVVEPTLLKFHNWWTVFIENVGSAPDIAVFGRTFCGGSWAPSYAEGDFKEEPSQRLALFFGLIQALLPHLVKDGSPVPLLDSAELINDEMLGKRQRAMAASAALRMHAKRLVVTENKLAGLAPQLSQKGDKIAVLFGCDFPVVLRAVDDHWELIGEVYIDGIMKGQAMTDYRAGKFTERTFYIY